MRLFPRYWAGRFDTWEPPQQSHPGYSLLVPVPGDLPVFLELALAVLGTQNAHHRVETLVIPDRVTKAMSQVVEAHVPDWSGPLGLVPLPMPERVILPKMRNPSRNHGVQFIEGVTRSKGDYIVLHDADLFILEPDVLDEHYRVTKERDLHVCGVSPVWDDWFAERGLHLAATWELCARRDWLRSFPPHLHMGHTAELFGEQHVFDTTLHAQALTDPQRVAVIDRSDEIVHFNYVISTYRHFERSTDDFLDDRFRLLLIRIFIDLFAEIPYNYVLPSMDELHTSLAGGTGRVQYPAPTEQTCVNYVVFRDNVSRVLEGPWARPVQADRAASALQTFDEFYRS